MAREESTSGRMEPINLKAALARCGDDRDFLNSMLEEFVALAEGQLLEIDKAIGASDAGAVDHVAHSMKGAAASLGAESVAATALELERCGKQSVLEGAEDLASSLREQVAELKRYVATDLKTVVE